MRACFIGKSAACAHKCLCVATEGEAPSVHPLKGKLINLYAEQKEYYNCDCADRGIDRRTDRQAGHIRISGWDPGGIGRSSVDVKEK